MITKHNIMAHELIGLDVNVQSKYKNYNISGKIIDETKNMFNIQLNSKSIWVPKNQISLKIMLGNDEIEISGQKLNYKPVERSKRILYDKKKHRI
ncbi:MAG: ribonuclease P protein component 1 [Thermoplasmata archaeon]